MSCAAVCSQRSEARGTVDDWCRVACMSVHCCGDTCRCTYCTYVESAAAAGTGLADTILGHLCAHVACTSDTYGVWTRRTRIYICIRLSSSSFHSAFEKQKTHLSYPICVESNIRTPGLSFVCMCVRVCGFQISFVSLLILRCRRTRYVDAGDFTAWKKLRNSLSFNLYFYVILGVVCVLGVIFVAALGRIHVTTVVHVSIAASNTFGLLFGVVLLGYGLVEAPRSLWRNSSPQRRLDNYHVRIGQTHSELQEARYRAKKYIMVKDDISAQLPRRDELHVYLDKIENKFARQLPDASVLNSIVVNSDEVDEATLNVEFDEDGLALLRRKLRNAVSRMKRLEGKMDMLIRDGLRVSDFVGEREALRQRHQRGDGSGSSMLQYAVFQVRKFCSNEGLRRSLAVVMGIVSASIIFSETTIATKLSNLSVFSLMIRSTAVESGSGAGGLMDIAAYFNMLLVLIPIAYMCFCSYFSLFKLRMFTFYSLSLRQTDAYSLILNASLACRFAAPLCYNYLFMIHIAGSQTSFGRLMGSQIDNVPFFGANFNEYFPIVVLVYTATIYFKVRHFSVVDFHNLFQYVIDSLLSMRCVCDCRDRNPMDFSLAHTRSEIRSLCACVRMCVRESEDNIARIVNKIMKPFF